MAHPMELGSIDLVYEFNHWKSRSFSEPAPQRELYRNTDSSTAMMAILFTFQAVIQFNTSFKLFRFI